MDAPIFARSSRRLGTALLPLSILLLAGGCAAHGPHGGRYGEPYHDHRHATEGALVGGLAGAGVGSAIAGWHHQEAGFLIGGALGALTGALIGDAMDREHARPAWPAHEPPPDVPPPSADPWYGGGPGPHGGYDDDHPGDGRYGRYEDDDGYRPYGDDGYRPYGDDDGGYEDDRDPARDYGWEPPSDEPPQVLSLPGEVLFAEGSDRLERGAERRLRSVATALRRHPGTVAVVRGHASPDEPRQTALAEARARAVRAFLVDEGVAPSRVVALGMGARFPVASERTPEGRQRNRRVEIEVRSDRGRELAGLW